MLDKIISGLKSMTSPESENVQFSIGITTFEARFEKYFIPLLERIREFDQQTEIIVAINGEHKKDFNESFRKKILEFLAAKENVFPVVFPHFRGLAKLWNTLVIHASHDHILVLNDDIMVENARALNRVKKEIQKNEGRSFVINESWSHFLINKAEIDELGYFDERLLGIGEEDGDLCWRYMNLYGRPIANFKISGFKNFAQETMSEAPLNIVSRPNMKYSEFNRNFIMNKYEPNEGGIRGIFDKPVKLRDSDEKQYPNEKFFHQNKNKI